MAELYRVSCRRRPRAAISVLLQEQQGSQQGGTGVQSNGHEAPRLNRPPHALLGASKGSRYLSPFNGFVYPAIVARRDSVATCIPLHCSSAKTDGFVQIDWVTSSAAACKYVALQMWYVPEAPSDVIRTTMKIKQLRGNKHRLGCPGQPKSGMQISLQQSNPIDAELNQASVGLNVRTTDCTERVSRPPCPASVWQSLLRRHHPHRRWEGHRRPRNRTRIVVGIHHLRSHLHNQKIRSGLTLP